jgi:N-acetylglucosaminyldiphosphoundecaprenol N-acetyl-beta-D-mannosaminyltransferase
MNTETFDPATCRMVFLLGIPFHDVTMEETLSCIDTLIARRKPSYLATANLDFAAQASRDVELQRILFDAELVLCDGTPLLWAARWLGAPLRERVAGSDLMPRLFEHCTRKGHSIFFLGSSHEVLAEAVKRCRTEYPTIDICGVYAPPYAKLLEINHEEIAKRIADAQPDILLVAMGCPKQEKWIYMNYQRLGVPVSIGIGASLDFIAGKYRRAPVWMRSAGLEWLFRMMQEPRRLFSRYYFDLLFFIAALRRQKRILSRKDGSWGHMERVKTLALKRAVHVNWSGRIDAHAILAGHVGAVQAEESRPNVVLDCSGVTFIDSTGMALFIKTFRSCKQAGGTLIVLSPSEAVMRVFSLLHLGKLIPVAQSTKEIDELLPAAGPVRTDVNYYARAATLTVMMPGDITAATVSKCSEELIGSWEKNPFINQLLIDLSKVSFIDSSGLGFLLQACKLAQKRGGTITLKNATDNVRNVIHLANLQSILGLERI